MSHPEFDHLGTAEDRAIEECAELIQAIAKAERFGWLNVYDGYTNLERVKMEIHDARAAINRLEDLLHTRAPR